MALAPLAYVLYTRVMSHNPSQSGLVRPRPLRALGRARVDAALLDPVPDRLPDDARGHRELPPGRLPDRGPPGAVGHRPGSRRRPVRSARGSRCRSVSRSRSGCSRHGSTRTATRSSTTTRSRSPPTATSRRASPSEASSLAGHLGLGRLIAFYDDNKIQLAGPTSQSFSEDVGKRYEAYGWHVQNVGEDLSLERLEQAPAHAMAVTRPPLADHRPLTHRLRQPAQAGHLSGARLAARRGRGPADQGGLRLGSRQALLRARRGARALPPLPASAAASSRPSGTSGSRPTERRSPSKAELLSSSTPRGCPTAGTRAAASLRPGGQADRDPQGVRGRDPVGRGRGAAARRRLGRPRALDEHRHRRRRRRRARTVRRPQSPLRRPRARDGGDRQRPRRSTASGPLAPPSSPSPTTCAGRSASRR